MRTTISIDPIHPNHQTFLEFHVLTRRAIFDRELTVIVFLPQSLPVVRVFPTPTWYFVEKTVTFGELKFDQQWVDTGRRTRHRRLWRWQGREEDRKRLSTVNLRDDCEFLCYWKVCV